MIKDLGNDTQTFANKHIKLEFPVQNARNTTSRIDLYCEQCVPPLLKIEYKSGPGSITEQNIVEEFIQRDLYNATSIDQIQWRMEGTYFTREQLVVYLQQNREVIEDLGIEKINNLFNTNFNELSTSSEISDSVINYFNSNNNFTSIFKQ